MTEPALQPDDALLIVDVQRDFCPGGALPIEEGDRVVPVLNRWIDTADRSGTPIYASRDWHPPGHVSFRERGGDWPIHCVQDTQGARFHPDLRLPNAAHIISKGKDPNRDQYSALDRTSLAEELKSRGVRRIWVGGLAEDVCVHATVMDALDAGFEVHLIEDATRAVNVQPGDGERALREMRDAGAIVEYGAGDG